MRRQDLIQIVAFVGVSVFTVGCAFLLSLSWMSRSIAQENESAAPAANIPQAGAESSTGSVQPIESAPTLTEEAAHSSVSTVQEFLEPFIYDLVNRRDPFQPYAEVIPTEGGDSAPRTLSPAQRFDLEQLRLVGIMWDVKEPKAMFMDPDQEVLVLGRDESIGSRNGYIAAIREGEVVVVEAIPKRDGTIYRTRVLRIER